MIGAGDPVFKKPCIGESNAVDQGHKSVMLVASAVPIEQHQTAMNESQDEPILSIHSIPLQSGWCEALKHLTAEMEEVLEQIDAPATAKDVIHEHPHRLQKPSSDLKDVKAEGEEEAKDTQTQEESVASVHHDAYIEELWEPKEDAKKHTKKQEKIKAQEDKTPQEQGNREFVKKKTKAASDLDTLRGCRRRR